MKVLSKRSGLDLETLDKGYRELRQTQRDYQEIVESVSDIILRISPKGRITYANSAISLIGYKSYQVIGHTFTDFIDDEDQEAILNDLFSSRNERQPVKIKELWLKVNPKSKSFKKNKKLYFLINSSEIWTESTEYGEIKKTNKRNVLPQMMNMFL